MKSKGVSCRKNVVVEHNNSMFLLIDKKLGCRSLKKKTQTNKHIRLTSYWFHLEPFYVYSEKKVIVIDGLFSDHSLQENEALKTVSILFYAFTS